LKRVCKKLPQGNWNTVATWRTKRQTTSFITLGKQSLIKKRKQTKRILQDGYCLNSNSVRVLFSFDL
jgi:hypothetical protein